MKKLILSLLVFAGTAQADMLEVFTPDWGSGISISVTETASTATQLGKGSVVLIGNKGVKTIYCVLGDSSAAAGTADLFLLPGIYLPVKRNDTQTHISCVCVASETSTALVITGE